MIQIRDRKQGCGISGKIPGTTASQKRIKKKGQ